MTRIAILLLELTVLGCSKPGATSNADFDFGGYQLAIENSPSRSSLNSAGSNGKEKYDITWDNGHHLIVEEGKLTIDGKKYGTLAKGDHIYIDSKGIISVNGQKRSPQ